MKFPEVKNIIFDLGGVLLDLKFDHALKEFQRLNRDMRLENMREFIHHPLFTGFETGDITPDEFRNRLRHLLKNDEVPDEELDNTWCAMLGQVPESKVQLLRELTSDFSLFLYSNTNAIHIPYFRKAFKEQHSLEWEQLFRQTFYSHEIRARKPNLPAYSKVISLVGIDPAQTLFVDDLETNVAAAAGSGMHALHYLPEKNLRDELFSYLGVSNLDFRR